MSSDGDQEPESSPNSTIGTEAGLESFFSNILTPGSSLHPAFLAIVDGAFLFLFLVLVALGFLTSGNLHVFALIFIELGLWGSIKWFVSELQNVPNDEVKGEETEKKDQ